MGGWKLAEVLRSALDRIRGCHPEAPLLSTEEAECRAAERFVAEQAVQREYSHLGIEALPIEDCGQGQAGLCHYLGGRTTLPRPWLPLQRPAWVVPGDARLSWEAGHNGGPALGE